LENSRASRRHPYKANWERLGGEIRGRPNEDDLLDIDNKVREVLKEVEIANEL
jgi:hypothetical protein